MSLGTLALYKSDYNGIELNYVINKSVYLQLIIVVCRDDVPVSSRVIGRKTSSYVRHVLRISAEVFT